MFKQAEIDFEGIVHENDSNPSFLSPNRKFFGGDLKRMYDRLMDGERLSFCDLKVNSRRMSDLRQAGFTFSWETGKRNGRTVKVWYASPDDKSHNLLKEKELTPLTSNKD